MADVYQRLREHPFFRDFSDAHIQRLAALGEPVQFSRDTMLMRYQQPADEFLVLLDGQVVLLNRVPGGRAQPVETITAPSVVGWSWLVPPYQWHFDVRAQSDIAAIRIAAPRLRQELADDTEFASQMYRRFMTVLVDRLQSARLHGLDVYAPPGAGML